MRWVLLLCCGAWLAAAAPLWRSHTLVRFRSLFGAEEVRGSALSPGRLYLWGDRLAVVPLDRPGAALTLLKPKVPFGDGGCLVDVDQDGQPELVLQQGRGLGQLVLLRAPDYTPVVIDTGVEFRDCLGATLFGRRGVLVVHRFMQVRFYEIPPRLTDAWPMQEVYSFYTASKQGGLLQYDVDGDGRADLFSGNYWIDSPAEFELPWRLFAINVYNQTPESAFMRLALAFLTGGPAPELIAVQGAMPDARLLWFSRPADPQQQWPEHRLGEDLRLQFPQGLATGDFNQDGRSDIAVGESNGRASRVILFWNEGQGRFRSEVIATTSPVQQLYAVDNGASLLAVTTDGLVRWTHR